MIDGLPEIAPALIPAVNRLSALLPLTVPSPHGSFVLDWDDEPAAADWPAGFLAMTAEAGGCAFALACSPALLSLEAQRRWRDGGRIGLPSALESVLRDYLLADWLDLAERALGERPRLGDGAEPSPGACRLVLRSADGTVRAVVTGNGDGIGWLARRLPAAAKARNDVSVLNVGLLLTIDRFVLTPAEAATVTPGSIVLLDRALSSPLSVVAVIDGRPVFRAETDGRRLNITAMDPVMTDPETTPLDDLSLAVDVDLGRLTMPLPRIRELAPGQVIDLGFDATQRVFLRVNGQVVAVGELVRVAERTGVRVTETHLPPAR